MLQLSTGDIIDVETLTNVIARLVDPDQPACGAHVIIGTTGGPFVIKMIDLAAAESLRDTLLIEIDES